MCVAPRVARMCMWHGRLCGAIARRCHWRRGTGAVSTPLFGACVLQAVVANVPASTRFPPGTRRTRVRRRGGVRKSGQPRLAPPRPPCDPCAAPLLLFSSFLRPGEAAHRGRPISGSQIFGSPPAGAFLRNPPKRDTIGIFRAISIGRLAAAATSTRRGGSSRWAARGTATRGPAQQRARRSMMRRRPGGAGRRDRRCSRRPGYATERGTWGKWRRIVTAATAADGEAVSFPGSMQASRCSTMPRAHKHPRVGAQGAASPNGPRARCDPSDGSHS